MSTHYQCDCPYCEGEAGPPRSTIDYEKLSPMGKLLRHYYPNHSLSDGLIDSIFILPLLSQKPRK